MIGGSRPRASSRDQRGIPRRLQNVGRRLFDLGSATDVDVRSVAEDLQGGLDTLLHAARVQAGGAGEVILEVLRDFGESTLEEVAKAIGLDRVAADTALNTLSSFGAIEYNFKGEISALVPV